MNTSSLNPSKYLSTKLWLAIAVVLFVIAFILVSTRVYQSQPAQVVINPKTLNSAQYQALKGVLNDQEVGGFFTANLPDLKNKVMAENWISQVDIHRQWGEGIVITALPRAPIARFGSDQLIDSEGQVFKPINESRLRQKDLILLQGDNEQSSLIMKQMQQVNQWFAPLSLSVNDLVLTPRMTWVIRFNDGLRVIVDNERTSQKLMNLSQLLQNQLADKMDDIDSIDLRYKNGFVIAWKEDKAPVDNIADADSFDVNSSDSIDIENETN